MEGVGAISQKLYTGSAATSSNRNNMDIKSTPRAVPEVQEDLKIEGNQAIEASGR